MLARLLLLNAALAIGGLARPVSASVQAATCPAAAGVTLGNHEETSGCHDSLPVGLESWKTAVSFPAGQLGPTVASDLTIMSAPQHPLAAAPIQGRSRKAQGTTLMIIGGAAFVGGLLIGDTGGTLIALGGLGLGAYGLIIYLE